MCPEIQSVFERNVHVLILTILNLILNNFSLWKPFHRNRWQLPCFFFIKKKKSTFRVRLCWAVKETVSSLVISTWQKKPQARKEGEETKLKIQYSTHHLLWFPTQLVLCQLQMSFCFNPKTEKKKPSTFLYLSPGKPAASTTIRRKLIGPLSHIHSLSPSTLLSGELPP